MPSLQHAVKPCHGCRRVRRLQRLAKVGISFAYVDVREVESQRMRRAARVDASQTAIVSALEAAGASVWLIGRPVDLLVGLQGRSLLMECKTPGTQYGKKPNKNQQKFMDGWRGGPVCMVDSPEAALRALGVLK